MIILRASVARRSACHPVFRWGLGFGSGFGFGLGFGSGFGFGLGFGNRGFGFGSAFNNRNSGDQLLTFRADYACLQIMAWLFVNDDIFRKVVGYL